MTRQVQPDPEADRAGSPCRWRGRGRRAEGAGSHKPGRWPWSTRREQDKSSSLSSGEKGCTTRQRQGDADAKDLVLTWAAARGAGPQRAGSEMWSSELPSSEPSHVRGLGTQSPQMGHHLSPHATGHSLCPSPPPVTHTHTRPFLQSRAGDSHTVAPGPSPAGLAHGCQDLSAHPARARGPLWVNGGCPPDVGGAPGWRRTERPRQGQNHSCLLQHKPEPSKGPSARTPRAPRAAPRTRQAYRQELRVPLQSTRLRAKENP